MGVISVTYSMCLVYKISDLRTFNFSDSKAIGYRSVNFCSIFFSSIHTHTLIHCQKWTIVNNNNYVPFDNALTEYNGHVQTCTCRT